MFKFRSAYVLTIPSENYLPDFEAVVLGVRVREDQPLYGTDGGPADGTCTEVTYILNGEAGHVIYGRVAHEDEDDGVIEIEDQQRSGNDGSPVYWRFEPLTVDRFMDIESIQGKDQILNECHTDAALQEWYVTEFLPDWWKPYDEAARRRDERETVEGRKG